MRYLRNATQTSVKVGPFVDSADGVTAETGLTITQADVRLSKAGGDFTQKNAAASLVHDENGYYDLILNTTDLNTKGPLVVAITMAGALPVWHEFQVMSTDTYDALAGAGMFEVLLNSCATGAIDSTSFAAGAIDAAAIASSAITADAIAAAAFDSVTILQNILAAQAGKIAHSADGLTTYFYDYSGTLMSTVVYDPATRTASVTWA